MSLLSLLPLLPKGVSIFEAEHLLVQAIEDTFAVNLAAAAAATWVAYDITLTFSDEVALVWKAKWSMPKVLYFFVRYYALFALIFYVAVNTSTTVPLSICRGWPYYEAFGATLMSVLFGEGMFLLRLYASYERNKKILALIVTLYLVEITTAIVAGVLEGRLIPILPRPPNFPMPGCFTLAQVPLTLSLSAWIVNLVIATIYLLLMINKFFTGPSFKAELSIARRNPLDEWSELRRLSPLMYLLLRDGLWYFVMVFVVNLMNLILAIRYNGRALEGMGIAWIMAVYSIASSRLCLNLRGFMTRGQPADDDDELNAKPMSLPTSKTVILSSVILAATDSPDSSFSYESPVLWIK